MLTGTHLSWYVSVGLRLWSVLISRSQTFFMDSLKLNVKIEFFYYRIWWNFVDVMLCTFFKVMVLSISILLKCHWIQSFVHCWYNVIEVWMTMYCCWYKRSLSLDKFRFVELCFWMSCVSRHVVLCLDCVFYSVLHFTLCNSYLTSVYTNSN